MSATRSRTVGDMVIALAAFEDQGAPVYSDEHHDVHAMGDFGTTCLFAMPTEDDARDALETGAGEYSGNSGTQMNIRLVVSGSQGQMSSHVLDVETVLDALGWEDEPDEPAEIHQLRAALMSIQGEGSRADLREFIAVLDAADRAAA